MVRIAVDAMGGDHAPREIIKGALLASQEPGLEVILVGDLARISAELKNHKLPIVPASEVIAMTESPAQAVRQKKDASINVAINLVKAGRADAVISAGNTGALMAAALFKLGRISGIERPAIAATFPLPAGNLLLLDVGANSDCKPAHLEQFAVMGSEFARQVLHINSPRVGLLNIGEEAAKGNELTRETYPLLKAAPINFIGNVESKELLQGKCDVVVCDGFVGNLILKFSESLASAVFQMAKDELAKGLLSKIGLVFLAPALMRLRKKVTYDDYGGAPLLGIDGVVYKAHGRAKAKAIKTVIRAAAEAVKGQVVKKLGGSR